MKNNNTINATNVIINAAADVQEMTGSMMKNKNVLVNTNSEEIIAIGSDEFISNLITEMGLQPVDLPGSVNGVWTYTFVDYNSSLRTRYQWRVENGASYKLYKKVTDPVDGDILRPIQQSYNMKIEKGYVLIKNEPSHSIKFNNGRKIWRLVVDHNTVAFFDEKEDAKKFAKSNIAVSELNFDNEEFWYASSGKCVVKHSDAIFGTTYKMVEVKVIVDHMTEIG